MQYFILHNLIILNTSFYAMSKMQIVHKNIYNNLKNKYQNHFAKCSGV